MNFCGSVWVLGEIDYLIILNIKMKEGEYVELMNEVVFKV